MERSKLNKHVVCNKDDDVDYGVDISGVDNGDDDSVDNGDGDGVDDGDDCWCCQPEAAFGSTAMRIRAHLAWHMPSTCGV
eukprot:15045856-Ditylum_brightwellii.AAC.1